MILSASKIIATSPDKDILKFLKKIYKNKILFHKREEKLGGINIELDQTLKSASKFAVKKKIKFEYIFQLNYKTPFLKSRKENTNPCTKNMSNGELFSLK